MRRTKNSSTFTIKTKFQGETYSANYSVILGVVKVASIHGSRSIPVGRSKAEITARWLHLEILKDAKSHGEISAAVITQSDPLKSRSDFIPTTRKEARRSFYSWKKTHRDEPETHNPKVTEELEESAAGRQTKTSAAANLKRKDSSSLLWSNRKLPGRKRRTGKV